MFLSFRPRGEICLLKKISLYVRDDKLKHDKNRRVASRHTPYFLLRSPSNYPWASCNSGNLDYISSLSCPIAPAMRLQTNQYLSSNFQVFALARIIRSTSSRYQKVSKKCLSPAAGISHTSEGRILGRVFEVPRDLSWWALADVFVWKWKALSFRTVERNLDSRYQFGRRQISPVGRDDN